MEKSYTYKTIVDEPDWKLVEIVPKVISNKKLVIRSRYCKNSQLESHATSYLPSVPSVSSVTGVKIL